MLFKCALLPKIGKWSRRSEYKPECCSCAWKIII
jgi:hypothetical protein